MDASLITNEAVYLFINYTFGTITDIFIEQRAFSYYKRMESV